MFSFFGQVLAVPKPPPWPPKPWPEWSYSQSLGFGYPEYRAAEDAIAARKRQERTATDLDCI